MKHLAAGVVIGLILVAMILYYGIHYGKTVA